PQGRTHKKVTGGHQGSHGRRDQVGSERSSVGNQVRAERGHAKWFVADAWQGLLIVRAMEKCPRKPGKFCRFCGVGMAAAWRDRPGKFGKRWKFADVRV